MNFLRSTAALLEKKGLGAYSFANRLMLKQTSLFTKLISTVVLSQSLILSQKYQMVDQSFNEENTT
jgi:hypothetical protein